KMFNHKGHKEHKAVRIVSCRPRLLPESVRDPSLFFLFVLCALSGCLGCIMPVLSPDPLCLTTKDTKSTKRYESFPVVLVFYRNRCVTHRCFSFVSFVLLVVVWAASCRRSFAMVNV